MPKQTSIEGVYRILQKMIQQQYGFEIQPAIITDNQPHVAPPGSFIYCIKPLNGDAVIASALDLTGNPITGLASITIKQGNEFKFPLSSITLTSGVLAVYYATNFSTFNS